ncbi:hypothetical protein AB4Y32_16225 [Paraburkholderia phymatum]|uniref:Uncharacterized protein n=1 Tax=Paraburkholderia phymatum TaxID=148447 RepID=A0ACC6U134_9BURK
MTDLQSLSNDELLSRLASKGRSLECFERADGQAWYDERQQREQTKREYNNLVAEWVRRGQPKGETSE